MPPLMSPTRVPTPGGRGGCVAGADGRAWTRERAGVGQPWSGRCKGRRGRPVRPAQVAPAGHRPSAAARRLQGPPGAGPDAVGTWARRRGVRSEAVVRVAAGPVEDEAEVPAEVLDGSTVLRVGIAVP